jgi:AcrR family transcriptional regulator
LTAGPAPGDKSASRMKNEPRKSKRSKARGPSADAAAGAAAGVAPALSPKDKLLDAAERLLIKVGYSAITTRLVSQEAAVNHGLVHYYYGTMEDLFLAVAERFTARLIVRQRAMYAADTTFLVKWRTAMGFLEADLASGYPKVLLELEAMGWNRPPMRKRLAAINNQWRKVLTEAFAPAMRHYGIEDGPLGLEAIVALVMTFNQGIHLERLLDVSQGHAALLRSIDRWLAALEAKGGSR